MEKVPFITVKDGQKFYNIACSEACSDAIVSGRLLIAGKDNEVAKRDAKPMYYRDESMVSKFVPNKK